MEKRLSIFFSLKNTMLHESFTCMYAGTLRLGTLRVSGALRGRKDKWELPCDLQSCARTASTLIAESSFQPQKGVCVLACACVCVCVCVHLHMHVEARGQP